MNKAAIHSGQKLRYKNSNHTAAESRPVDFLSTLRRPSPRRPTLASVTVSNSPSAIAHPSATLYSVRCSRVSQRNSQGTSGHNAHPSTLSPAPEARPARPLSPSISPSPPPTAIPGGRGLTESAAQQDALRHRALPLSLYQPTGYTSSDPQLTTLPTDGPAGAVRPRTPGHGAATPAPCTAVLVR